MIALVQPGRTNTPGHLVADILGGSWRKNPAPTDLDAETLSEILPLLMSGASGLAWRRIRGTRIAGSQAAVQLQDIYRYDVLRNAIHARDLNEACSILRDKGIESVLVKGWSLDSLYPEPGLRPFGDIDLCVRPGDYRAASAALTEKGGTRVEVDLHSGFGKFYEERTEELFARSVIRDLDGFGVRVLRFEDHFRFLCLHLLRHGGVRPLWLCDIAAALESMTDDFDWDLCLSENAQQAELIAGVIGIAHDLLEANIDRVPKAGRPRRMPGWMLSTVLSEWSVPFVLPSQLAHHFQDPMRLLKELPRHWPNPIAATINLGGRLNDRPRWPLQVGDVVVKTWGLLTGSRGIVRPPG